MPDGRPQHQVSWTDGLLVLEDKTGSINGAPKEGPCDTTSKGAYPSLPPRYAWTSDNGVYINKSGDFLKAIRCKAFVHFHGSSFSPNTCLINIWQSANGMAFEPPAKD